MAVLGTPNDVAHVQAMLVGMPDDTIAISDALAKGLVATPPPSGDSVGVIVAGVNNHRGVLRGLHGIRKFAALDFNPAVSDGVDGVIFNYVHAQLRGLLLSPRDSLDFLVLMGDIYSLVFSGLPRVGCAMRILGGSTPEHIPQAEIQESVERNIKRLTAFRMKIIDLLVQS